MKTIKETKTKQRGSIKKTIVLMSLLVISCLSQAANPLLRHPDVFGDTVVFEAGEDIWKAPLNGGEAVRLTFNDGQEVYPKFSPDGKLIAFTGEYDGNPDVYVMNTHGGNITRVTYHPGYDRVVGWNATTNKIIFSSGRNSTNRRFIKLFEISPDGTGLKELIMYDAAQGSFSPDGTKIAYNKIGRENRTWKRYHGGMAQEIYIYDFTTNKETNISNYNGTDRLPMWIGNQIYFSSDRDRELNIFAYDTQAGTISKITNHTNYDVRWPSADQKHIVYELAGDLWCLDLKTKETHRIPIAVLPDMEETRPYMKDVSTEIKHVGISPTGTRALVETRGEIFSVPAKDGITRNLTQSSGAHDKDAVWSPDGKWIAYLSDKDGEYNLYLVNPNGEQEAIRLTSFKDGYRHTLKWSPDSKKIAFTDQTLTLYYIDVTTKAITKVDREENENVDVSIDLKSIYDFSWSPDSRFLAYSKMNKDFMYQIYIYSLENKLAQTVSNGLFHDFSPVFTKDGNHLLFISNRQFDPTYCDLEWEMVYKKIAGIYAITLKKDGKPLFPMHEDEENGSEPAKTAFANVLVSIDFDGIADRIEVIPLKRGNYRNLSVNESSVFYKNADDGDFNRFEFRAVDKMSLYAFNINSKKENKLVENVNQYDLSADGKQIIYRDGNKVSMIAVDSKGAESKVVDVSNLKMMYHPKEEWKQIFNEAWRMERDYYYEPGMHGLDWNQMKSKYRPLVDRASCRQDLTYLIGELIGELNTSHTYVMGGDIQRHADRVNIGMLGVNWKTDARSNRYQFDKIFKESDWSREIFPPLAKPGINVNEGDYLLKVNGKDVKADKNIYSYFVGLAGQQVTLLVNSKPSETGAREVVVEPTRGETGIRYIDGLEANRKAVEKASGGKIGYIYLPDTYMGSAIDFPRYFYSQTKKDGIILDGRFNSGGLDPEIFLQRLRKKPHGFWTRRYSADQTIPALAVQAHMVCLTNHYAGSGGDELPYEFRWNHMGPIIGTRSWGGLVGVSMFIELVDGGGLTAPDYRIYNEKGEWVVENHGIQPDIEIEVDSEQMSKGTDNQLMKAVEVLMKQIDEQPVKMPVHQPYPTDN